jgi:hypothetical protein
MDVSTDASTGLPVPYRSRLCLLFQVPIRTASLHRHRQSANGAGSADAEAPGGHGHRTYFARRVAFALSMSCEHLIK